MNFDRHIEDVVTDEILEGYDRAIYHRRQAGHALRALMWVCIAGPVIIVTVVLIVLFMATR